MKRIEAGLHALHAVQAAASAAVSNTAFATATTSTVAAGSADAASAVGGTGETHTPFAKINSVEPDSPAAEAGMRKGDYIKRFGSVNALNHQKLKKLAEEVSKNDGVMRPPPPPLSSFSPRLPKQTKCFISTREREY